MRRKKFTSAQQHGDERVSSTAANETIEVARKRKFAVEKSKHENIFSTSFVNNNDHWNYSSVWLLNGQWSTTVGFVQPKDNRAWIDTVSIKSCFFQKKFERSTSSNFLFLTNYNIVKSYDHFIFEFCMKSARANNDSNSIPPTDRLITVRLKKERTLPRFLSDPTYGTCTVLIRNRRLSVSYTV